MGFSSWGRWVGHDWATSLSLFNLMHWRRKWQPTPVFLPGESQGWYWWAGIYWVAQSWTPLKRLSSNSSSGKESLRRNGVAIIVTKKRVQNTVLGCNLKNDRMISVPFQGKPFNITVIQVYAPTSNTEEAEVEQFYEDLQDLLELTPPKDVLFITGDRNAKVGSQETLGVTAKFGLGGQNEAGKRLIDFCQENALVIANTLPTTQAKTLHMNLNRRSTPKSDWLYSLHPKMEKLYTVSENKTWSWLWLRSWTPYCQIQTEIEESKDNH